MSKIPESMIQELNSWNNGSGVDLETWVNAMGNHSLAIGYTSIFWPEFVVFEGFILNKNFNVKSFRSFDSSQNRLSTEWVMNHIHLAHIHSGNDMTKDKLVYLGNTLKEIYEVKLSWQFPESPCTVEFYIPEDIDDLSEYQISFWQNKHEVKKTD
jgi:hypothetical protein